MKKHSYINLNSSSRIHNTGHLYLFKFRSQKNNSILTTGTKRKFLNTGSIVYWRTKDLDNPAICWIICFTPFRFWWSFLFMFITLIPLTIFSFYSKIQNIFLKTFGLMIFLWTRFFYDVIPEKLRRPFRSKDVNNIIWKCYNIKCPSFIFVIVPLIFQNVCSYLNYIKLNLAKIADRPCSYLIITS